MSINSLPNAFIFTIIMSIISVSIIDIVLSNPFKPAIAQINSFETASDLSTYSNSTYGIKIKHPSDWEVEEADYFPEDRTIEVVNIWAPYETYKDEFQERITIYIDPIPYKADLKNYLDETFAVYSENENYELIESNTNSMLSGLPAYSLVHTYTLTEEEGEGNDDESNYDVKAMEIGTIIGDTAYFIIYLAEEDKYFDYLEVVQNMINSFRITNTHNLNDPQYLAKDEGMNTQPLVSTYNNLGIEINFPSEWEASNTEESRLLITPREEIPIALIIEVVNIPDIENSFQNEATLTDNMYSIMNNIREDTSITDLRFINSQPINLNGYSGFQLELKYEDISLGKLHELSIYTAKGNSLYSITYLANPIEYQKYLPIIVDIISSFQITNPYASESPSSPQSSPENIKFPWIESPPLEGENQFNDNDMTSTNQGSLTYTNSFGMKMQYPSTWEKNEDSSNTNKVSFIHPDGISLILINVFKYENPLNQIIAEILSSYTSNTADFTPIESKPISIAGQSNDDAHMLIYSYSDPELGTMQAMEVFVVEGNLLYNFVYDTHYTKYSTHLPSVLNILKSIEFNDTLATNDNPNQQQLSPPASLTPF